MVLNLRGSVKKPDNQWTTDSGTQQFTDPYRNSQDIEFDHFTSIIDIETLRHDR